MSKISCRVIQKTDTAANWKASDLIPYKGEIILYETSDTSVPFGVKIGDGEQTPDSLPFIDEPLATKEYVNTMVEDRAPVRGVDYWTDEDKEDLLRTLASDVIVMQSEPPEDTAAVWVDPDDDFDDGFQEALAIALKQAKDSGEFDGKTPVIGIDYFTESDKAEMLNSVIAALPVYNGEVV